MPTVQTNDIETFYKIAGSGPTLVLVHGAFVDHRMWEPQVEAFAKRFRVITYDLRGHGQTGPSTVGIYTYELLADDLRALLDALDVDQAVVCGLSLGGMVAQAFGAALPNRLSALILCDTAAATALTLSDKVQRYLLFPEWMMQGTLKAMGVRRFIEFSFWLAGKTRSEEWLGHDETVRQYVRERMRAVEPAEYRKLYHLIYNFPEQELSGVCVPALVLYGENESASVKHHARVLEARLERSERVEVAGAGHMPNMEHPALFNETVLTWLDRSI